MDWDYWDEHITDFFEILRKISKEIACVYKIHLLNAILNYK